mmetsp:Transcript_21935/g.40031  ORF Transcript_21935/g.40031 Transcript_21935/m.40031 type:complete len:81 (+) Transcript_21935:67-309(+)
MGCASSCRCTDASSASTLIIGDTDTKSFRASTGMQGGILLVSNLPPLSRRWPRLHASPIESYMLSSSALRLDLQHPSYLG